MTWPLGQVIRVTAFPRSGGGACVEFGAGVVRTRRKRVLGLAMGYAGHLVFGCRDNPIRARAQQVLRALAPKEAVDRREPIRQPPTVLPSIEYGKDLGQLLERPVPCHRIKRVAWKIVDATVAYGEDQAVLLPFVGLSAWIARAETGHFRDLRSGQPVATLQPLLARFGRHPSFDEHVLRWRHLRDQRLNDRVENLLLALLQNGANQRSYADHRLCQGADSPPAPVLQGKRDHLLRT